MTKAVSRLWGSSATESIVVKNKKVGKRVIAHEYGHICLLLTVGDISWERRLCLNDRNAILMMSSLPRIWSEALIGWHSNIAISFKLSFTEDRQRQKVTKVKIWMNLLQNSHYSWNIFVFRRNIWVLLSLVCREIDQEKHKLKKKFYIWHIWNLMTTRLIMQTLT